MKNVLLMLTVAVLLGVVHGTVVLNTLVSDSRYHPNTVRMTCSGGAENGNLTFHNRVGNTSRLVVVEDGATGLSDWTLEITPATEGEYYCMVDGEQSNTVALVAYPHSDPNIERVYTASLGENLEMRCTIPLGALRDRYSVQWYKGDTEITSEEFRHITSNSETLEFSGVKVSDASKGYYCVVAVELSSGVVRRQGSTIALHVSAPLHMTRPLSARSTAAEVGAEVNFTCQASGIPVPAFRWSLNGSQISAGVTTMTDVRTATIDATSILVLPSVVETDTGSVTCVAFHEDAGDTAGTVLATSSENLIVLTNNFEVDLAFQDGQVVVTGTLPVFIVGFFFLEVRFYSTEHVTREEGTLIPLADTNTINIVIPRGKLPSFRRFSVAVAIGSNNRFGELTEKTDSIDLGDTFTDPLTSASASGDNSVATVVPVVVVLIVLGIVVIVVVIGGMVYCKRSAPRKATSESSVTHGSFKRSASRCSYASQGSRHSSRSSRSNRSRTYGSESVVSDCTGRSADVELKMTKEEIRDIRDYETIDHKMLKQWEENKAHLAKGIHGSCEDVGPAMPGRGPVFPHTHIGIPNPHHLPRPSFKDSQSSFEDLEEECLEFSTEVPKSC